MQYILDKDKKVFAIHEEDQKVLELYGEGYTSVFSPKDMAVGHIVNVEKVEKSPAKLSKRALISYLSGFDMWGDVRRMIDNAGMMDLWNATNLIDFADPDFQAFLAGFATAAGAMGLDMDDMINHCRYFAG